MPSITLKQTISSFLDEYKLILTKQNLENYFRSLYRLEEYFGDIDVSKITNNIPKLRGSIASIKDKYNLNIASVYFTVIHIKTFLKYCVGLGLIKPLDVDKLIDFKKYARDYQEHFQSIIPEAIYPFDEYEMRLYWIQQNPSIIALRNAMFINILFETGIKIGELLSISKINIKPNNTIELLRKEPRTLNISETTSKLVNAYISQRKDKCEYLIINHSNHTIARINRRSIERIVDFTSRAIKGLIHVTPTVIRQSYIARKISEGNSRRAIQNLAGYKHYTTPQLNKFSLKQIEGSNSNKNVSRYLEDFQEGIKLKSEFELSQEDFKTFCSLPETESRNISKLLLLRESQIIKFIHNVEQLYKGWIPVAVRQKEWKLSRDLFVNYSKIFPDKIKRMDNILHIDESVDELNFIHNLKNYKK